MVARVKDPTKHEPKVVTFRMPIQLRGRLDRIAKSLLHDRTWLMLFWLESDANEYGMEHPEILSLPIPPAADDVPKQDAPQKKNAKEYQCHTGSGDGALHEYLHNC